MEESLPGVQPNALQITQRERPRAPATACVSAGVSGRGAVWTCSAGFLVLASVFLMVVLLWLHLENSDDSY